MPLNIPTTSRTLPEDEPERVLHCPACAGTMKLVKIVPKLGGFPRLMTFQCLICDEFLTIESEE